MRLLAKFNAQEAFPKQFYYVSYILWFFFSVIEVLPPQPLKTQSNDFVIIYVMKYRMSYL